MIYFAKENLNNSKKIKPSTPFPKTLQENALIILGLCVIVFNYIVIKYKVKFKNMRNCKGKLKSCNSTWLSSDHHQWGAW